MAQSGSDLRLIGPPTAGSATNDSGDQALLENFDAHNKIRTGVIFAEVNHELNVGRKTLDNDPGSVRQNLRLLLERVLHAPELSADNRAQLRERIEATIKLADTRLAAKENEIADQQKSAAAAKEQTRIEDNVKRGQERVKQLIERFNSLLREGRYAEAEDLGVPKRSRPRPILRRLMPRHSNRG